jgi:hypothetical protein
LSDSDYDPIPSLGNRDEMEKVFIIPTAGTLGPFVWSGGIITKDSFVAVDPVGYVKPFLGCPVHSPDNNKIVGKAMKSAAFGEVVLIDMQFNIRNDDCTCEVDDIQV